MEQNKKPNRPVHEVRVGLVRGAVWANKAKDGRERMSLTVSRIYPRLQPDGKKSWGTTDSFGALDLPLLQKALDQAFEYMQAKTVKVSNQPEPAEDDPDRVASLTDRELLEIARGEAGSDA